MPHILIYCMKFHVFYTKKEKNVKKRRKKEEIEGKSSIVFIGSLISMELIQSETIKEIRNKTDIKEVIGSYIPLIPKGKNYFGVCPFHDDHSPSLSVSKEKQIYTCFVCHESGNVFNFLMKYENISFVQAVKICADRVGIPLNMKEKIETSSKFQNLYDIYELSLKFYENNINTASGKGAKEYLLKRGITEEIRKEFGIGLALKKKDLFTSLLFKKEYPEKEILKSGLVNKNETGYHDIFYNRIMFPLWDLNGKVVAYSGRIYDSDDSSKYINTKQTEIFKKGELLYNYHRAKTEARIKGQIILMEGFMDVIASYQIGVKNTIALMGTALTKNHVLQIKKLAKEILICLDGDEAGEKATSSCIEAFLKVGVTPKIVRLEENLDPDEYIRKYGEKKFLLKLENPLTVMDFKLGSLKKEVDLKKNEGIAEYAHQVIEQLSFIEDDILKEVTLNKLSLETNLSMDFLRSKMKEKDKEIKPVSVTEKEKKWTKYEKAERNLLFYMLHSEKAIQIYNEKVTFLPTEKYRKLLTEIRGFYLKRKEFKMADFISDISIRLPDLLNTFGEIESMDLKEEWNASEIEDYINTIQEYNIKYESNRLQNLIKKEIDPKKQAEYAQLILELKKNILEEQYDK